MNLQFSILFSDQECLTQQLLKVRFKLKFLNILAGWKKVTAPSRVWKFWEYSLCQNSALIMANGIRKVRKGVDIFDKKMLILVSSSRTQCFRIRPRLQQSFPCSQQSINRCHSTWCTTYQDSTSYASIFLVSASGRGKRRRETSSLLFSFFSK